MTDDRRALLLDVAAQRRGMPYRLDPPPDGVNNIDCSLYVLKTYEDSGIPFRPGVRTAEQIRQASIPIDWSEVLPGDLLFFEGTYEPSERPGPDGRLASHIGMSLGAGTMRMWDAHGVGVQYTDISSPYWQGCIFEARRHPALVDAPAEAPPEPAPTSGYSYAVLPGDGLNLREQPSLSGAVLEQLPAGTVLRASTEVLVESDGYRWLGTERGWVAADYVRVIPFGGELSCEPESVFDFAELWPHLQAACAYYGADAQVVAAIAAQESGFRNFRVHYDGTGHGLFGLDDSGGLIQFEQWSGMDCGRGAGAIIIPPGLQIECTAMLIAKMTQGYGDPYIAARAWHRGPSLWTDWRGDQYEALIRAHVAKLFAQ